MKPQNPKLRLVETRDGSYTLRIVDPDSGQESESMHSHNGAYSESLYIYNVALQAVFDRSWPLKALSMGLGAGYNELLFAAFCVKQGLPISAVQLSSYELYPSLNQNLLGWLFSQSEDLVHPELVPIYEDCLSRIEKDFQVSSEQLRCFMQSLYQNQRWNLNEAFSLESKPQFKASCLFFDAFSSKTSPDLWSEPLLKHLFDQFSDKTCLLSTYAATGVLTRSLKASGFEVTKRPGFVGKRESTLAIRE